MIFLMQDFIQTMESEYTALHVYLQDPAAFGIDMSNVEPGLGSRPDMASQKQAVQAATEAYEQFLSFDRSVLSPGQQDSYDIYAFQTSLALALSDEKFDYYAQQFESMGGLHYQLPTPFIGLGAAQRRGCGRPDCHGAGCAAVCGERAEYTKEQAARGLLMADLDEVIGYCESVLQSGEDSAVLSANE